MLAVSCLLGAPFLTTLAFDSFVRASFCCSCACVLILVGGAVCADCRLCSCVCIVVVCESVKAAARAERVLPADPDVTVVRPAVTGLLTDLMS